jgi:hypothetical protein
MARNSTIHPVSIGNGLFTQIRRPETIGEAYRRIQRTCKHERRDPEIASHSIKTSLASTTTHVWASQRQATSMEGQKTVLGKVSGTDDETSIFVVISLKVLD